MQDDAKPDLVVQIARIIDPSSWAVMDSYLEQTKRKYRGQNVAWPEDQFQHKESMAKAREILDAIRTPSPAQPADVDSGMSGPQVERAEVLWANLPTGREWTSLATHEKALACHVFARAALAAMPVGGGDRIRFDVFYPEGAVIRMADGNLHVVSANTSYPPADADAGLVERVARETRHLTFNAITMDEHRDVIRAALAALGQGGVR